MSLRAPGFKLIIATLAVVALGVSLFSLSRSHGIRPAMADPLPILASDPEVVINTNEGAITLALYQDQAPITVANFLGYARSGFYDRTIFHRVIQGFMIQGGGYTADFVEKPHKAAIRNEADNGLHNLTSTIAMARMSAPNSASAQFFINVNDNSFLDFRDKSPDDYGYCVFGRVISGMNVVQKIAGLPTHADGPFPSDVPVSPVIIRSVQILRPGSQH